MNILTSKKTILHLKTQSFSYFYTSICNCFVIRKFSLGMKKWFLILGMAIATFRAIAAPDVSVACAAFKSGDLSYVEIYLNFVGSKLEQEQVDSIRARAHVEVAIQIKLKDSLIQTEKYRLKSPVSLDPVNFIDQKRYSLKNGHYDVWVEITDLVDSAKVKSKIHSWVNVDFDRLSLRQSDIELLAAYQKDTSKNHPLVKNGYFLEPLPFGYYDRRYKYLSFYNEIYNADKGLGAEFLFSYAVVNAKDAENEKNVLIGHQKRKGEALVVNLFQIDIGELPSGNYKLVTSIRNQNNDLLDQKETFFQRSNPDLDLTKKVQNIDEDALMEEFVGRMDAEQLRFGLKAIAMMVKDDDISKLNLVLQKKDTLAQRRFLYQYWFAQNHQMPENAYDQYMYVARQVDKSYKNASSYGFETDRGIVYMKYGRPTDIITVENEQNAPPYEIWVYHSLEKTEQNNVKFLFYNPSSVANSFRLLHSNCHGELSNPRWQTELYRNAPASTGGNPNHRAAQLFNE
jgi:GWxTD domain-containing protein